jgi:regulator of CtrA degradation
MGELSEFQLRRYGSLAADLPSSDPGHLEMLDSEVCTLVEETERFYARLLRLDRSWRQPDSSRPSAIERLRARLANQL